LGRFEGIEGVMAVIRVGPAPSTGRTVVLIVVREIFVIAIPGDLATCMDCLYDCRILEEPCS
jgi:hypothetical protein